MEQPTIRIELPGGAWATVYRDVLRRTARLQEAELRRHMTPVAEMKGSEKMLLSELRKGKEPPKDGDYLVDFGSVDNEAISEAYILNQVKEWSLGPMPITSEDIGMMSGVQYKALVEEMDRLYKSPPLPKSGE
jgi:hypothetical protein